MMMTPIYTIGYGKREIDDFLRVLQAHAIKFLIDVRSSPYSKYKPEFSKQPLVDILKQNGIQYVFMGDTLGGRPKDPACYTADKIDYAKVAQQPFFQAGIQRLHNASQLGHRVVLMCAEGQPENCHRANLIGPRLINDGVDVRHIDELDRVQSQEQIELRLTGSQPQTEIEATTTVDPHLEQILAEIFGYPHFRSLQREIIQTILAKGDSLAIMPTGSGKSLCYQLPATLFPGLTVVVSPLIALMEDQVLELQEWGIPAVYLNSTLTATEYGATMAQIRANEPKLLYAAPETLLRPEVVTLLESCPVDCLVIDEAHCISEWGHEFRPEYRQLAGLRARLPDAVTLAVTATATQRVRADIKNSLGIPAANVFVSSFDRENLVLAVTDKINGLAQAQEFIDAHKGEAGIIYCSTRAQVDTLTVDLQHYGYPVLPYHAGMADEARRTNQHRFRYEDDLIMVATIAFGMGINKSNVRFILHYNLPKNLESYYQQIGRAGRDGLRADCLVLYSYSDVSTIRYFIEQEDPQLRPGSDHRLQTLLAFLDARECRRKPLLSYFGENYTADSCGACDYCRGEAAGVETVDSAAEPVDLTAQAQKFLQCVQETRQLFGMIYIIDVLRGSRGQKILAAKHDQLASYGTGTEYNKDQWRQIVGQFIKQGLVQRTQPHGSLVILDDGESVLDGEIFKGQLPKTIFKPVVPFSEQKYEVALYDQLRALRLSLAQERNIPSYVVFPDRSLIEMAQYFPLTAEALGQIYGVGARKLAEYAPHFLPIIQAYCQENDIQPTPQSQARRPNQPALAGQKRMETVWELFQSGKSISEIAAVVAVKPATVLKHLQRAHEVGRNLDLENLKKTSKLSAAEEHRVIQAFEKFSPFRLRPIFDAMNGTVSYDQLHLWRLIYEVQNGQK
jgi:ATP-dependent DNA helicase RecQ